MKLPSAKIEFIGIGALLVLATGCAQIFMGQPEIGVSLIFGAAAAFWLLTN